MKKKKRISSSKKRAKRRKVVSKKPRFDIDAQLQKAVHSHRLRKMKKAEKIYQKILRVDPDHAQALYLLGIVSYQLRKPDAAVTLIKKAIHNAPDNPTYLNDLGTILKDLGGTTESIPFFERAVHLKPDFAGAYNNLGLAFKDIGRLSEAIMCYRKAVALQPDYGEAYNHMGVALLGEGLSEEAIGCYRKALELSPDDGDICSNLVFALRCRCVWKEVDDLGKRLDELNDRAINSRIKPPEPPFYSLTRSMDLSRNFSIARSWSMAIDRGISAPNPPFSFDGRKASKPRINIGYLSNDFGNHPVAHLMQSLFGLHDRDAFQVFCYFYGVDDHSSYRKRIENDCDMFVDLQGLSHADAARQIWKDNVDILVDLNGHTEGNRLEIPAFRPAPIQVSYLGFPGTTGAPFLDYVIADKVVCPESHIPYYSEKIVYLPHCYQINNNAQAISGKHWTKQTCHLPEGSFVFCSFNQPYKISREIFDCWMNILRQISGGVLWLSWSDPKLEENLRREAEARDVSGEKLVFAARLPLSEHLARLKLADIALDTQIYNGGATTSNALWAGVPVVTIEGGHYASRMGSSMLGAVGLPELIAHSLVEYESVAVRLARNPNELAEIRKRLAGNRQSHPLFDTPRSVKCLEKAYKEMWEIFALGQNPRRIEVADN